MRINNECLALPVWQRPDFDPFTYLYQYRAIACRTVDGDTLYAYVDKGMGDWMIGSRAKLNAAPDFTGVTIRLARINAYEVYGMHKILGKQAKALVCDRLPTGTEFRIYTYRDKSGKYGRLLADIRLMSGQCLNDLLVAEGLAVYQKY